MHYKVEKNATRKGFARELSVEALLFQLIKRGPFLGLTAPCSIPLDRGKSWLNCALKRAIFTILAQRNGRRRPGYRDCYIYLIVSLGLATNLGIKALFLPFYSGVAVVSRLEK